MDADLGGAEQPCAVRIRFTLLRCPAKAFAAPGGIVGAACRAFSRPDQAGWYHSFMASNRIPREFRGYAASKLAEHFAQVRRCAGLLSDEQLWFRPNEHSNSVANLLLHLNGNVGQWILGGLGGQAFERHRQAEFDARGPIPRGPLLDTLEKTVSAACELIGAASADALMRTYRIQEYEVSGVAAIFHVVEHFAFHTGQIVTTAKWLLDVELSLYDEDGHRRDGRDTGVP